MSIQTNIEIVSMSDYTAAMHFPPALAHTPPPSSHRSSHLTIPSLENTKLRHPRDTTFQANRRPAWTDYLKLSDTSHSANLKTRKHKTETTARRSIHANPPDRQRPPRAASQRDNAPQIDGDRSVTQAGLAAGMPKSQSPTHIETCRSLEGRLTRIPLRDDGARLRRALLLIGALCVAGALAGCADNSAPSATSADNSVPRPGQVVPRFNLGLDVMGVAR